MKLFFRSFTYAFNGIKLALQQRNFKVLCFCAILTIVVGFTLRIDQKDWCIILICIGIILSLEIVNTTIENLVNLVEPNQNPKAGAVKDLAAGAVLLFSFVAVICGVLTFGKYILALLHSY